VKALIEIDRRIWGKVKNFATVRETSLNTAVGYLLNYALDKEHMDELDTPGGKTRL
jgi:hypothetical protein